MAKAQQTKIIFAVVIALAVIIAAALALKIRSHHETSANTEVASATDVSASENKALPNLFDNKESRYRIRYPFGWEKEESGPGTIVFSGKSGTPSFYSTVNVQSILSKKSGGDYTNLHDFVADIKKQARQQSNHVKFLQEGTEDLTDADGKKMTAVSLLFTYDYKGVPFKQWQIVAVRNDQQVFYAWAYTSPVSQYENDYPLAKQMLDSWVIY